MQEDSSRTNENEIFLCFQVARKKLDKVDADAKKEKIQIVRDLARALEGKIPTDRIAVEIVHQLRGKVSERLIHGCLDEKYKCKYIVDNAKKQKHRKRITNENLAAPVPLEQQVQKGEIMVDRAGNEVVPISAHDTNYNSFGYSGLLGREEEGHKKCKKREVLEQKCEELPVQTTRS